MDLMKSPSRDDSDLLARMEQNLVEHACHLHRHMSGTIVVETGDLLVADSGLADDTFNIVAAARFTPTPPRRGSPRRSGRWPPPAVPSPGGWAPPPPRRI